MRGYDEWGYGGAGVPPWARGPRQARPGGWPPPPGWGYDRGLYGDAHPGPAPGGYGAEYRGYGRPSQSRGGYGGEYHGYARDPFLPEHAYRRHPELDMPPERGPRWGYELDDTGAEMGDAQVLDGVRRRLYEDVWLDVDRIDVAVEDGVVTLTGEVDDFLEARYAWDDAWETRGVRGVVNQLVVRTDRPHDQHGDALPQDAQGTRTEPTESPGGALEGSL